MGLSDPAFPASEAFDAIQAGINENPKDKADAVKKANAVFAFTLKNAKGETASWHVDLKQKGEVAKGEAPQGGKADGKQRFTPSILVSVLMVVDSYVDPER